MEGAYWEIFAIGLNADELEKTVLQQGEWYAKISFGSNARKY